MTMPDASRPPRRTYGRARPQETSEDQPVQSLVYTAPNTTASPSKALLSAFTKQSNTWLGATRSIGQDTSSAAESDNEASGEAEPTDAEIEAEFLRLKRNAAGGPPPTTAASEPKVTSASRALFGSSSLTELPTSTPPSNRPKSVSPLAVDRQSIPPSSLSDHDNEASGHRSSSTHVSPALSPAPVPRRKASGHRSSSTHVSPAPSPAPVSRRKHRVVESEDEDEDVASNASLTPKAKPADSLAWLHDDDSDDDEKPPTVSRPANLGLFDDDDDTSPPRALACREPLNDLDDIDMDEDEEHEGASQSLPGKLPKPLSKSDQEAMRRDIARAQREKNVHVSRPCAPRRPVTQWMARAHDVVSGSTQHAATATAATNSPPPLTSDEIQQFTPSSGPMRRNPVSPTSSPTPGTDKLAMVPRASPQLFQGEDVVTDDVSKSGKEKDRLKQLSSFKNAYVSKLAKWKGKARDPSPGSDDDLSILPDEPIKGKLAFTSTHRQPPNARPVIARVSTTPAPTSARQNIMKWAGKRPSKPVTTETHMDFAGRQFGHAGLKWANGGSRPAGQKAGRDEVVSQEQVDYQMRAQHLAQVRAIAKTKEKHYGNGRALPEKCTLDLTALVNKSADEGNTQDFVADSDDDDSDFAPSDVDEPAEDDNEEEQHPSLVEGTIPEEVDSDGDDEGEADMDEDKENHPIAPNRLDADDDDSPFIVHSWNHAPKHRKSRRILGSDDEDEDEDDKPHQQENVPLRETSENQPKTTITITEEITTTEEFELDLAGFGSAGGGFSQLFGATQAVGGGDEADAFDALRNAAELDFLPSHALLPGVEISETQKRRDNALIAAEFEDAPRTIPQSTKKQYLNSQGFFTQTRPAGRGLTQTASAEELAPVEEADEGSSTAAAVHKSSSTLLNSAHDIPSPTEADEQSFSRLRRRKSESMEPSPTKAKTSRNVFDVLNRGAARQAAANKHRTKPAFLDEQAEESDEDNGWGLNTGKDDDDDEDLDNGYIPELLDDNAVDDEQKKKDAELAALKFREVEQADDARLEAEAKKVTEGHFRQKRNGNDFVSDDEDEDGKPRRWTKKQKRQRKLDRQDGLSKLVDDEKMFLRTYEEDLESDNEFEEAPPSPRTMMSPEPIMMTAQERQEMLRQRARMNQTMPMESEYRAIAIEEDSQYAISKKPRAVAAPVGEDQDEVDWSRQHQGTSRTLESYSKFVSEESINPRRTGTGGVSVVVQKPDRVARQPRRSEGHGAGASESRGIGRQASSILLDRNESFK